MPVDAYCGTFKVFENRDTKQGRQLDLNIVVLPALSSDPKPDPFFFLAGGPGQGAAQMAKPLRELFRQILTERDIVLVDQRGTGKSNPLNCIDPDESLKRLNEPEEAGLDRLKKCMAGYDADLRLYTTSIAMDDLDDVRALPRLRPRSMSTAAPTARARPSSTCASTAIASAPRCSTAWRRPTCGCRCSSRAMCSARSIG